jgi:hypothetical protein
MNRNVRLNSLTNNVKRLKHDWRKPKRLLSLLHNQHSLLWQRNLHHSPHSLNPRVRRLESVLVSPISDNLSVKPVNK